MLHNTTAITSGIRLAVATIGYNIVMDADLYKIDHINQYPKGTRTIFSTIVARKPNKYTDEVVVMGHQYVIKQYLLTRVTMEMIDEAALEAEEQGQEFNRESWEHIVTKHNGKLPLRIRAIPEGTVVPVGTAIATIENTDPECFWLTSYIETLFQRAEWKMTTVASICRAMHKDLLKIAKKTDTVEEHVAYAMHNFGDRGADAHESAIMAAMAHLSSGFVGTDCYQANRYIKHFYNTTKPFGTGVVASEHSVMCANTPDANARDDYAAAVRMVDRLEELLDARDAGKKVTPIVSIVGDTYDIYRFAQEYIGTRLKGRIERLGARGGKIVVRPDSGDPIEVPIEITKILMECFGYTTTENGYKMLPPYIGVIQGDGINQGSLRKLVRRLVDEKLALGNMVFGMGGGLTHEAGRDEFSFAQKATAREDANGVWHDLFKDPITDIGKRSLKGRVTTYRNSEGRIFSERIELQVFNNGITDMLETVYLNGELVKEYTFEEVVARATA